MRISDWSSDVCSSDLDHVVQPPAVALREQATVGVEREAALQGDVAIDHEVGGTAGFGVAERLELEQDHVGEAVVDLEHVDVLGTDTGSGESTRCSTVDAPLEQVRTPAHLVGRRRVSLRSAQVHNGWGGEGACPTPREAAHS